MESDLEVAQRAALTGAAVALRYFAALADVPRELKADGSVVTAADRAVESAIRDVLAGARPADAVLGEEQGQSGDTAARGRRWIVDPIDGTAMFVAGEDRWLTLVALEEDGEIVVAVAAHPAQGTVWWATRGGGVFEGRIVGGLAVAHARVSVGREVPGGSGQGAVEGRVGVGREVPGGSGQGAVEGRVVPGGSGQGAFEGRVGVGREVPGGSGQGAVEGRVGVGREVPGGSGQGIAEGRVGVGSEVPGGLGRGHAGTDGGGLDAAGILRTSRFAVVPERRGQELVAPVKAVTPALPWRIHPALMVARGELDVAVQTAGQIWDFAATSLIVTEAGGSYSGVSGRRRPGAGASVYARSEALRRATLELIGDARPDRGGNPPSRPEAAR